VRVSPYTPGSAARGDYGAECRIVGGSAGDHGVARLTGGGYPVDLALEHLVEAAERLKTMSR
jgi:hypothetical protein